MQTSSAMFTNNKQNPTNALVMYKMHASTKIGLQVFILSRLLNNPHCGERRFFAFSKTLLLLKSFALKCGPANANALHCFAQMTAAGGCRRWLPQVAIRLAVRALTRE